MAHFFFSTFAARVNELLFSSLYPPCERLAEGVRNKNVAGSLTEITLPAVGTPEVDLPRAGIGRRWAGILLVLAGTLTISLIVGEAFAGMQAGGIENEHLNGTAASETLAGRNGTDTIYGFSGDDGLSGGRGNHEIYGGAGRDVLLGGAGDDFLEARDGHKDYVGCGAGRHDMTSADEEDKVSGDCEYVYRS